MNTKQPMILKFSNDSFVEQLFSLLMKTGKVKVSGLGIFEIRTIPAREGFDPNAKKRIVIKGHNRVGFKPTKRLKELSQSYGKGN